MHVCVDYTKIMAKTKYCQATASAISNFPFWGQVQGSMAQPMRGGADM